MQERDPDRSAGQAPPRLLEVRDWLAIAAGAAVAMPILDRSDTTGKVSYVLIGLIAFAMGMQMNAIRLLDVPGISTTAATATYISLVSGLVTHSLKARDAARLAAVLVCMAAGAALGDWMLRRAHSYAPLPSVLVSAIVIVIALAARGQRSASPRLAGALALAAPGVRGSDLGASLGSAASRRGAARAARPG